MQKRLAFTTIITFLAMLLLATACTGPGQKVLPQDKEHPMLSTTPGNANLQCALQDKAGNLWFGTTNDGLFKYDGKAFIPFKVKDGLNSHNISCLLEAKDGKIWIGTMAGLCVYNGDTITEIKIPLPKNLPPNKNPNFQNHWVYSMLQDKTGKLWFATIDGVYVYDGTNFSLFEIKEAPNAFLSPNDKVERILEDKAGNIWLGGRTNSGVFRYDGTTISNLKLPEIFQKGPKPKAVDWGWPQLQDKNGDIWFSSWGGAYRYDGKTVTSYSADEGLQIEVTRMVEDQKGNLWFGCSDGLRLYDGKTFTHFKDGLVNPWIWSVLVDKDGQIWVGTRDTGLYLFDGQRFIPYSEPKQ